MASKAQKNLVPRATVRPHVVGEQGEPVGAFLRILSETRAAGLAIEKFDVTADLVLEPPNESATKAMDRYRAADLLAQTGVLQLMQYPESPPDAPEPPHNQVAFELERLANKVT